MPQLSILFPVTILLDAPAVYDEALRQHLREAARSYRPDLVERLGREAPREDGIAVARAA